MFAGSRAVVIVAGSPATRDRVQRMRGRRELVVGIRRRRAVRAQIGP